MALISPKDLLETILYSGQITLQFGKCVFDPDSTEPYRLASELPLSPEDVAFFVTFLLDHLREDKNFQVAVAKHLPNAAFLLDEEMRVILAGNLIHNLPRFLDNSADVRLCNRIVEKREDVTEQEFDRFHKIVKAESEFRDRIIADLGGRDLIPKDIHPPSTFRKTPQPNRH